MFKTSYERNGNACDFILFLGFQNGFNMYHISCVGVVLISLNLTKENFQKHVPLLVQWASPRTV